MRAFSVSQPVRSSQLSFALKDYEKAAGAYSSSRKISALHHPAWFALGCAYLEPQQFKNAIESFSRCVQLDDQDAEAWSNLAAALLHMSPTVKEGADEDAPEARITRSLIHICR